jgi:hypothetical protein
MGKKDKPKKISPKKERYSKFHKEKSGSMDVSMPDLSEDQMARKREDEMRMMRFLRSNPKPPIREVNARKAKSKR